MQGRAADVKDVSERVLDILCGVSEGIKQTDEPSIIAADDLAPSETVQLDKSKVLAFATMYGSSNSHTAILARTMNIPAVIGLGESLSPQYDGKMAVIDGFTGTLYIDPDEETLSRMQKKREEDLEKKGHSWNSSKEKRTSQRVVRRSMYMQISEMHLMLVQS